MVSKKSRFFWRPGDVVAIDLGGDMVSFAQLFEDPLIAFHRHVSRRSEPADLNAILNSPVLFRIWVHHDAFRKHRWKVVGHADLPHAVRPPPSFFKVDPLTKQLLRYETGGKERPARPDEVAQLEPAAVWDAEQVEERIRDALSGRRNRTIDAFRAMAGLPVSPNISG